MLLMYPFLQILVTIPTSFWSECNPAAPKKLWYAPIPWFPPKVMRITLNPVTCFHHKLCNNIFEYIWDVGNHKYRFYPHVAFFHLVGCIYTPSFSTTLSFDKPFIAFLLPQMEHTQHWNKNISSLSLASNLSDGSLLLYLVKLFF